MEKIDVENELDRISEKLRNSKYYDDMAKITGSELVELAILVDVLVIQLNQMLLKYPEFNHQIRTSIDDVDNESAPVKAKTDKNILLPAIEKLKTPRRKIKI